MKNLEEAIEIQQKTPDVAIKKESYMTTEEVLACFEGKGQTELPTRTELKQLAKVPKEHRKRLCIPKAKKKPSQSYLTNLNPRIEKAERLWHDTWAHERGALLKACGVVDIQEITELANAKHVPDVVLDHFHLVAGRECDRP